jgi:hypothetical protein
VPQAQRRRDAAQARTRPALKSLLLSPRNEQARGHAAALSQWRE